MIHSKKFVDYYDVFKDDEAYEKVVKMLDKLFRKHNVETVLDIGCGTGKVDKLLADKGYQIVGIDNSREMIKHAKNYYPKIKFKQANAADFKINGKFDAVIALDSVLTYLTKPSELQQSIKNIVKHMNKNAILFFEIAFTETTIPEGFKDHVVKKTDRIFKKEIFMDRKGQLLITRIKISQNKKLVLDEEHIHKIISTKAISKLLEKLGCEVQFFGNTSKPYEPLTVLAKKSDKLWWRTRGLERMEERFGNKIVKFIEKRLETEKVVRVLEIGFGEGKCLLDLRVKFPQKNVELYGINERKEGDMHSRKDFLNNANRFGLEIKKTNLPKPYFYDAGEGLKFESNFFDLIISQVAIHYVGNKAKLYEECWRVLKKEGKAFLHIDRTRIPALPTFLKVNTETPLHIVYKNDKLVELKTAINKVRKKGFDIKLEWSLPKKKQRNLVMHKNTSKPLKLGLKYDAASTIYLTKLKNSDPSKTQPGIWWGTRSVFHWKG